MTTMNIGMDWSQRSSFGMDAMSVLVAIALHVPLYYMKLDFRRAIVDKPAERLVSIDLIDPTIPKPVVPPPPPIVDKGPSLMERLKALVKKEPPPPPPLKKEIPDQKLADVPKPIELQAKLNLPEKIEPKLASKSGFQTNANPALIEDKKLAMQTAPAGIAPLSAQKLGTIDNRDIVKSDKGKFQISQNEKLSSIGGDGPGLAGAGNAPTIALQAGKSGSVEKFSAPITQKSDKGRLGNAPASNLGGGPNLGLRDSIIARDAQPSMINTGGRGGSATGAADGVPGGAGAKKDAGRFQSGGVAGGSAGSVGSNAGSITAAPKVAAIVPQKKKERSLFVITGPLKDRKIERQEVPEYPSWAQSQGIEASVVLEFTVDAEGHVKNNIVVRRTSGYPKLDETAIKSLRKWKFAPVPGNENREEVGQITFNFSLS